LNRIIWPIALFQASYFLFIPTYYGSKIQIYFYFFLLLIYLYRTKSIPKNLFNNKIVLFIYVLLFLQFIAMVISYLTIGDSVYNKNPFKTFLYFVAFVLGILIHYILMRLYITSAKDVRSFLFGGLIALIIALTIPFIQLLYIFDGSRFQVYVRFIGNYLEAHWNVNSMNDTQGFYGLGSYVETTKRVNGLTEEASNFVTQLFICFVPFILASIKNKYNIFLKSNNQFILYLLFFIILAFFVIAKTTSGFLFAAVVLFIFIKNINRRGKLFAIGILLLIILFVFGYNLKNHYLEEVINEFILNKSETSSLNRAGNTIALLKTFLSHIVIGVGYEYQSYFTYVNMPEMARHNTEYYLRIQNSYFPILSVLFGWLANYGLFIVGICFMYIYRLVKRLKRISEVSLLNRFEEAALIHTLYDSFIYYIIFSLICSLFAFVWYASIYLIIFFYFVSVISFLENKYMDSLMTN